MGKREEMIVRHLPLVTFVVGRMSAETQAVDGLDRDDAIGYGVEGLIQSVDNYDADRGTSFASFAVRRIRGSVLDAIRKQDPLPRSLRRSARAIEQASQELAAQLGRWPTHREIALRLGVTLDELHRLFSRTSSKVVSLERSLDGADNGQTHTWDPVDEDAQGDPARVTEFKDTISFLGEALKALTPRERAILRLRYGESMAFHEIGRLMGLSESRVCQLHKKILLSLRRALTPVLEEAA